MKYFPLFSLLLLLAASCDPQQDDKIDIGLPPAEATFTIEPLAEPNHYLLTNTTPDVFEYLWDLGNGTRVNGESVEAFYPLKGTYTITLTVFGRGGHATSSKVLEVPEDAPFDCESDAFYKYLTDCEQRVWKLKPAEGSLWVGPADGSTTWWQLPESEVAVRTCEFNDEWTFTKDGQMIYDAKGDVWAEPYMGFNYECIDESMLPPDKAAWGSGTHTFEVLPGNKLKVNGLGAYLGLPKVANGAEVTDPQTTVTYDVIRWDTTADGREMELEINFGAGIWRFIYISPN